MKTKKSRIEFEYEGKAYTLEYTADSLRKMQERGFDVSTAENKLLTLAEDLFCGAFIANHDDTDIQLRREIFKEFSYTAENDDTGTKIEAAIMAMFKEACEELRSHRGNVKWRIAN